MRYAVESHSRDDMPTGFADIFNMLLDVSNVKTALNNGDIEGLPESFH
jgi:hypothetical protein